MGNHDGGWAGDFLLVFGRPQALPPARGGAAWQLACEAAGACLYLSAPTAGWKGAPLAHAQDGPLETWLLGALWGTPGSERPAGWPGHFARIGYDAAGQAWHLWTNRLATLHVYVGQGAGCTAAGTYAPAVAAAASCRDLDWEALRAFFALGFFPNDRTQFERVKIVRPAAHLVFDPSGRICTQTREWAWQHAPEHGRSFDDTVDAFAALFHQVVAEQVSGRRVAFPISGGLDSRSTVAAVLQPGAAAAEVWAYSYGYTPDSVETRIARQVARAAGLNFSSYTIQPYLFEHLPAVIDSVEGFQDVTQCRQAAVTQEIAGRADYVMAAHWGDVWIDDMGLHGRPGPITPEMFAATAVKKFLKPGGAQAAALFQERCPGGDLRQAVTEMVRAEAEVLPEIADPDFRLKALKTESWSFRWTTASIRMFQPGAFPLLPFYDPRMVDFFCTVPTEYVAGRRLQVEYLKRYAPSLARIDWQVYDANLYWYPYHRSLLLPKRAVKKMGRMLRGQKPVQRNWEVQFLSPEGKRSLEAHLLNPSARLMEHTAPAAVAGLLDRFFAGPSDKETAYAVCMLLTFAAWLEQHAA